LDVNHTYVTDVLLVGWMISGVTGVGVSSPSAAQLLGILLRSQRAVNIELRCGNLYRDDLVLLEFRPSDRHC
jgi:hypothetical protein